MEEGQRELEERNIVWGLPVLGERGIRSNSETGPFASFRLAFL